MITLQRFNVVKEVESETQARKLEEAGFKRVMEEVKEPPPQGSKGGREKSKNGTAKEAEKGGGDNGSGANGQDYSGSDGQPQA